MSASELPIDMGHPAVREYLALVRLQVLTPLSLLINIGALLVCGAVIKPNIGDISSKQFPTSITPKSGMVATFIILIFAAQIGYCVLLVLARKPETKQTLIKGVGISLVVANWVMAAWAVAWIFKIWILSTIVLGILILALSYANIVLLIYHAPTSNRPLDTLFIHVPVRLFLLLPLNLLFWQSLFITLGWHSRIDDPYLEKRFVWEGFIVVFITNMLALLVVCVRRDIVWAFGTAWLDAALWSQRPKSVPVFGTTVTFTVVLPLALVVSAFVAHIYSRRQGAIVLPDEEVVVVPEDEPPRV